MEQVVDFTQKPLPTLPYEGAFDSVSKDYWEDRTDSNPRPEDVLSGAVEYEIQQTIHSGYTLAEIAKAIWIAGMVVLGGLFLFSNIQFSWKLKKCRILLGNINELCSIKRKGLPELKVYQTDVVETPCLYGLLCPSIYVTEEVMEKNVSMQHVLEHELTHYRHRDYIWSLLRVVCLVLHWYNPLVWWASILSRNDAELACDEATIKRLGEQERASYGRTLIDLTCEKRSAILITATTMTGSKKSIKERIFLIAKNPKMRKSVLAGVILLAVLALIFTFTGARKPEASFVEWVKSWDLEKFEVRNVSSGYGDDGINRELSEEEEKKFLSLIQNVTEEECDSKKQTASRYHDIIVWFFYDGKDSLLQCLSDKTILYVGHTESPEFALENEELIIDNTELWEFMVSLASENTGDQDSTENIPGDTENEGGDTQAQKEEQVLYSTKADLNHDGHDDRIDVVSRTWPGEQNLKENAAIDGVYVKVYLGDTQGVYSKVPVYTSNQVADSHAANGTYVLTEVAGKDYFIYSCMYEQQGGASYEYAVMYMEEDEMVVMKSDRVAFHTDPFRSNYWNGPRRDDVVPKFKEGFEPWIENATILVSYDVQTPSFVSTKSEVIPANAYYDLVWARNEEEDEEAFMAGVGTEEWQHALYWIEFDYAEVKGWIEAQLETNYAQWYTEYDGSKLQRIDKLIRHPNGIGDGGIPANSDVIYYRADAGEDEQDAIYKMIEKMLQDRMVPDDSRTYVITDYAIPTQNLIPISDDMWMITYLKGYYAFEGYDLCSMQELIDAGTTVSEGGLIPFFAQGSDSQYVHILMKKDGVYRLQRLDKMRE